MKKYIFLAAFVASGVISIAQTQDVMTVKMKDGTSHEFKVDEVSEVTFQAIETPHLSCPDDNHPHMIDLGLPSGTLWSCCNVDAINPEDYGGYYSWGEIEEKDVYELSTYEYYNSETGKFIYIGDDISGTEYDVAHTKWGGSWRMPTKAQQDELIENCTREWTQMNGVNGIKVTGPNGNTIFLPAAGDRWNKSDYYEDPRGYYWSSSLDISEYYASDLYFYSDYWTWGHRGRFHGLSVRPVITIEETKDECPVAEAIDLGLPSGTKWASWNVGASKPEEYGGYYAWGETEEKDYYDESTYKYYNSENGGYIHIGDDIAGTEYDVAHVKWGGSWRMPSLEQIKELINNCTRTWTTQNGVNGTLVSGPNGNSIFLPAASERWYDYLYGEGEYGNVWSSSLDPNGEYGANYLNFYSNDWGWASGGYRYFGRSVRAVCP